MRRHFQAVLATVRIEDLGSLDTEVSEGIDRYEDVSDVGIDFLILKSSPEIVVDAVIGDGTEQGHVVDSG